MPEQKEYQIIRVLPMVDIDVMGRFIKKYRVYYKFGEIEDWIDLKEEEFSKENAIKVIEAKIAEMKKLLGK